jgi:hypothetical protein
MLCLIGIGPFAAGAIPIAVNAINNGTILYLLYGNLLTASTPTHDNVMISQ